MLNDYQHHLEQREQEGLPPLPLDSEQVTALVELLKQAKNNESEYLLSLLIHRVPPGVDQAAYVKAGFLSDVAKGNTSCELINKIRATQLLGSMMGGYNIQPLIDLLDEDGDFVGFDVVIGNPPYIQLQKALPDNDALK